MEKHDMPFQITVNGLQEINLILQGLGELPGKMTYNTLKSLEAQYQALFPPKAPEPARSPDAND